MMHITRRRSRRRSRVAWCTALLTLAASTLAGQGLSADAAPDPAPDETSASAATDKPTNEKIQPELRTKLEGRGEAAFWVRFEDKADLSKASQILDWNERGTAVADALKATANASQADVRAELDAAGVDYEAYWATNAIYVERGGEQDRKSVV